MIVGVVIPADNTQPLTRIVVDKADCLMALARAVGGYVERYVVGSGIVMYMNEDGRRDKLPRNQRAIDLIAIVIAVGPVDIEIVGDVVVFANGEDIA